MEHFVVMAKGLAGELMVIAVAAYIGIKDFLQWRAKRHFEKTASAEERLLLKTPEAPVIAAKLKEVSTDLKEVVSQTRQTNGQVKVVKQQVLDHEVLDDRREKHILDSIGELRAQAKAIWDEMEHLRRSLFKPHHS